MRTRHVENAITIYICMYVCMYIREGSRIRQANWERESTNNWHGLWELMKKSSSRQRTIWDLVNRWCQTKIQGYWHWKNKTKTEILILHLGFFNNSENPTSIGEKSHGWNPSSSIYVRTRDSKSARLRLKVCLWSRQMPLILARLVRLCFQQSIKSKKINKGF